MEMHIWVNTFLSVFSRLSLFLSVLEMVVREEREGMVVMVGLWGNPVNPVPTEEEVQTEAVQITHQVEQDAREEQTLMRTARFISLEQKNNVIQVHRTQRKARVCCSASPPIMDFMVDRAGCQPRL